MSRWGRWGWMACGLVTAAPLGAQARTPEWAVSASLSAFFAQQSVAALSDLTGSWVGGGVEAEWRFLSFAIDGYAGSVSADVDVRRVRLTDVALDAHPTPWLSLGVAAEALRTAEAGETSIWRVAGPLVGVTAPLGVDGLSAEARAAVFPVHEVAGIDPLASAARVDVGLRYAPAAWPASVALEYQRRTFTFADPRSPEALGGLVLTVRGILLAR